MKGFVGWTLRCETLGCFWIFGRDPVGRPQISGVPRESKNYHPKNTYRPCDPHTSWFSMRYSSARTAFNRKRMSSRSDKFSLLSSTFLVIIRNFASSKKRFPSQDVLKGITPAVKYVTREKHVAMFALCKWFQSFTSP